MNKNKHKIITFAALMTVATVVIHFINRTIAAAAQLKQLLGITNSKYFEWRFGNIYYTKKGNGKPILLIHDTLPGASGYEWSEIEEKLAKDHTVYTVDLLGCGRSDKPGITYTNFVYVQMICDFIRKIIGQKTDIIASGFSSSFVIMACHNEKELFNKIMLVNPPSPDYLRQMPTRKDHLLKLALEIPVFGTLIYHMIVSKENVANLFVEKMYYNPFHVNTQMEDAYYEASHSGGCYAKYFYSSMISKYMNINISHAVKSLDNSIYIVEGESEPNGKSIMNEYLTDNPAIETAIINGSKHIPQIENPEEFWEHIQIFF